MLLHEVVEQDANHRCRNARNDDLAPQRPGGATTLRAFARAKRIELVEEVHAHRQDGAQLDNDLEHAPELFRHVQADEFINENHVTRRRDGQPLGDALDQTEKRRFEQLDDIQRIPLPFASASR